jgi:eukaryotic-like serine/threonine-protein kinase
MTEHDPTKQDTLAAPTQGVGRPRPLLPADLGGSFGRYMHLELLGRGGMATVYRAYDPSLGRLVALKLIRDEDPALSQRLLMEARAQARIEHEHVCRIYEAGEEEGRPYIAMQYVEGRPLREVYPGLTLEQKLKLMAEVAEGLHAAHRVGLLHRDVKPSNVMVDVTDDGVAFPYVVDFGLALETNAPGVTATRQVMGTPAYMSPEQARGETRTLDRRSDVYSLGATLYEMLGGSPPFEGGSSVDLLMKLLHEEPAPLLLRDPGIPRDVQTIVMKCLEKEPARRYDSARALAQDIGRYLDGEPVSARPAGVWYRLSRRARKHKGAVAMGAVALVLVSVSAFLAVSARTSARKQVALAGEFARTVEDMEWIMRVAHMAPLHDTRREKVWVRERLLRLETRMQAAGPLARGPGEYAQGRGRLALGDLEGAKRHLEAAWKEGYRAPEVAYALGLTLGALYRGELEQADAIGTRELREAKRGEVQRAYRDPAVSYLRQSAGTDVAAPEYVLGLIAFYEKRHADALANADAAISRVPWLYEAHRLKGDVHVVQSRERNERGDVAGYEQSLGAADAAYRAAADLARSDPLALEGTCQLGIQRMESTLYARGDLAPLYEAARVACASVLSADPERAEAHAKLANIHRFWANHLVFLGRDPKDALDLAKSHAQRAIAIQPRNRRAHGNLGIISRLRARYEQEHGQDPSASLLQAFQSLQKAVELSGGDASSLNDLGNAYLTRALSAMGQGGDPRPDLAEAIANYDRALALVPDFGYSHANRGSAYLDRARYEMDNGADPAESLAEARRSLERAVALLPHLEGTHTRLADAHGLRARFQLLSGEDPASALGSAKAEMEAAAKINKQPGPDFFLLSGVHALLEARHRVDRGQAAGEPLDAARALFARAAALSPKLAEPRQRLGEAETLLARWRMATRDDPAVALSRGRDALLAGIRANPKSPLALTALSDLYYRWAAWEASGKADAAREIEAGLQAAEQALAMHPKLAVALVTKGCLLRLQAEAQREPGRRAALARQSEEALRAGLAVNRHLAREYGSELARAQAVLHSITPPPRQTSPS